MNFFTRRRGPDLDQGLQQFRQTPGGVLLDVRTRQEYSQGHLPQSRNLPLDQILQVPVLFPDQDTPLFVYCLSGARSARATAVLQRMGYQNVTDLGGIHGYRGEVAH